MNDQTGTSLILRVVELLSLIYVVPLKLLNQIGGSEAVSHFIKNVPIAVPILRAFGATIGTDTVIYPSVIIHGSSGDFSNLKIGNSVRIVRNSILDITNRIEIEDNVVISFGCTLITHHNIYRSPLTEYYPNRSEPIILKQGCVISANVTILMGVTVGECSMVAAGAVVTSDVPPWTLVGGIPARRIKSLR